MGGNVVFTPALQAPIALAPPTGQLGLVGNASGGGAFAAVQPHEAALSLTGYPPLQILGVPTAGTANVALNGLAPVVVQRAVSRQTPAAVALALTGAAPSVVATTTQASANLLYADGGKGPNWQADASFGTGAAINLRDTSHPSPGHTFDLLIPANTVWQPLATNWNGSAGVGPFGADVSAYVGLQFDLWSATPAHQFDLKGQYSSSVAAPTYVDNVTEIFGALTANAWNTKVFVPSVFLGQLGNVSAYEGFYIRDNSGGAVYVDNVQWVAGPYSWIYSGGQARTYNGSSYSRDPVTPFNGWSDASSGATVNYAQDTSVLSVGCAATGLQNPGPIVPGVVNNQRIVNQGGNTNDKNHKDGNVTFGQSFYWEPPTSGVTPDTYIIQRSLITPGTSAPTAWADVTSVPHTGATHYVFTDNTPNVYNATNVQEDFGSASPTPIGPTTVVALRVLAAVGGVNGVRGPAAALTKMMFYEGATPPAWSAAIVYLIGDRVSRSGGNYYLRAASSTNQDPLTNVNNNVWWQLTGGNNCNGPSYALNFGISPFNDANPVAGGTDIKGVSQAGQGGIQLALDAPLTWVYGGEIGFACLPIADGFFIFDLTPSRNGMVFHFAFHTRAPIGDVEPHTNAIDISLYGPVPVAGVKGSYRIPLKAGQFGVSTGTAVISNGIMTVTNLSGPGIDAAALIAGPNITTGTYVNDSPPQNGNGAYPVTGQVNAASGPIVIYHTSGYKWQVVLANGNAGDFVELDNVGVVSA